jgi:16S rRNA (guanine(966)-N(2))-methyltransferase RsmD
VSTLRITAGTLRGRRIPIPKHDVRPTSERARQAYFNIVADRIEGATFLDLFAGTGAFSFEAVSRGAASATAIDRNVTLIGKTARDWQLPVTAISGDVLKAVPKLESTFDLVYTDPPYDFQQYDELLTVLDEAKTGLVAIEHRKRTDPFTSTPERLKFHRRAEYGEVWITFFA